MTDDDMMILSRASAARLFTERGGTLLGEVTLAGFDREGRGAFSQATNRVAAEIADRARWGELIDGAGSVICDGPVSSRGWRQS